MECIELPRAALCGLGVGKLYKTNIYKTNILDEGTVCAL